MKFATVTAVLLMIIVCALLPKLPAIHTWAVEREEERIAEAELAEQKITMSDLTIKNTEVADDTEQRQLRLKLPAGVKGSDITISNDYVTQTVRIELPQTEVSYFENDPLTGSSNHIDNLSYAVSKGSSGLIEITMDQVYELDMDYDENYYYFDFLTPHEVYDKVVVVDAGHGGNDVGETVVEQDVSLQEKDITLAAVQKAGELLLAQGIRVYYTREDDSSRSPEERVGFANALQADMLISVHVTSAEDTKVYGIRTEYNAQYFIPDFSSADLAYLLLTEVAESTNEKALDIVPGQDDNVVIGEAVIPVAQLDIGFLSNRQERKLLQRNVYIEKVAQGICNAVLLAYKEMEK